MPPSQLHNPESQEYKKARRQYIKAAKHRNPDARLDWTPFRAAEKKYKARFPPPDLTDVLDLATLDVTRAHEIQHGVWAGSSRATEHKEIVSLGSSRNGYIVPRIPGLVILPSFVSPNKQRELIQWSLATQARHPNETNLDIHYFLPKDGIWNTWVRSRDDASSDILVQPRAPEAASAEREVPGPRQLVNNTPASPDNFSTLSSTPKPPQTPSATAEAALPSALLRKLRWANIGWYYHWGTKQYDFAQGKGEVNREIRDVCKDAVGSVDWQQVYSTSSAEFADWKSWTETYEPDAGIVNFYQAKDTLMAHVDRSEVCATSPLVSISLGNAAVFLIGGLTRDTQPVPILLRSGDVIIMSGPECRRAYHGVPRIFEGTLPPHFKSDNPYWQPYEEYMQTARININVRQVFPKGFDPEADKTDQAREA